MTESTTDPLSPSLLRSTFGAVGQYFVLPLAVLVVAVVTVHAVAVFGYEWQWALTKWGYPTLCVGALYALVFIKHWSVRSVLGVVLTLMVAVATAGYAYKRGIDDNGGLFQQRVDIQATTIASLTHQRDKLSGQVELLIGQLNESTGQVETLTQLLRDLGHSPKADTVQSENSSITASPERKPVRAYRPKPAPSWWEQVLP